MPLSRSSRQRVLERNPRTTHSFRPKQLLPVEPCIALKECLG